MSGWSDESEAVRKQVVEVPPRDPQRDPRQIDLGGYFTESFSRDEAPVENSAGFWLERLTEKYEPGEDPDFEVRGKVQLNSGGNGAEHRWVAGKDFNGITKGRHPMEVTGLTRPMKIEGLAIGQRATKLHFLQSCHWGREDPGVEVASYTVHYEDGSSEPIPVI